MSVTYAPQIFDVPNEAIARQVILTAEFGQTTDHRWVTETPYLVDVLHTSLAVTEDMLILDYGCGIGRVAKALIDRFGCRVIGVDISHNMRLLGTQYVQSPRFTAISPEMFAMMLDRGLVCDAAFSVWVLQHCATPSDDIGLIHKALPVGSRACVVNNTGRAVPTHEAGWINDGVDVLDLLGRQFIVERVGKLDPAILSPEAVNASFVAELKK